MIINDLFILTDLNMHPSADKIICIKNRGKDNMKQRGFRVLMAMFMALCILPFHAREIRAAIPEAPQNLKWATPVKASWDAVANADSYKVSLWDSEHQLVSYATEETSYDFMNDMVTYGSGMYRFIVRGINSEGNGIASQFSEEQFFLKPGEQVLRGAYATIRFPIAGELPSLYVVSEESEYYSAEVTLFNNTTPDWFKEGTPVSPGPRMVEDECFELYGVYFVDISFKAKEGYAFYVNNENVKLNGETGYFLRYSPREIIYRFWFTAQDPENVCMIAFETNCSDTIDPVLTTKGNTIKRPRYPVKENYEFEDWYTDPECTQKFEFFTEITGDMTLYARWIPIATGLYLRTDGYEKKTDGTYRLKETDAFLFFRGAPVPYQLEIGPLCNDIYGADPLKEKPAGGNTYWFGVELTAGELGRPDIFWSNEMIENSDVKAADGIITFEQISRSPDGSAAKLIYKYTGNIPEYAVSLSPSVHGSATVTPSSCEEGTEVTVKAKPDKGYTVNKITYTPKGKKETDITKTGKFKMPAADVTVKVTFKKKTIAMYRMYNPNSGEHFYTAKAGERDFLKTNGWQYEGVGWYAPETSKTPVYRLYNENAGDHHYTMNKKEKDALVKLGWKDEGTGWYSDDDKEVPLYREYNPNMDKCNHNYTTKKAEHDYLIAHGWNDEGIGWYGVKQ